MIRKLIALTTLTIAAVLVFAGNPAHATQPKSAKGEGRKLFLQYCASCHGMDGKGGGPVAGQLKTAPHDLTKIEKEDGKFPFNRVQRIVSGEGVEVHGTKEMPVWGTYLRRQKGEGFAITDNLVIAELTR